MKNPALWFIAAALWSLAMNEETSLYVLVPQSVYLAVCCFMAFKELFSGERK